MSRQLKSTFTLLAAAIIWGFAFVAQCVVDNNIIGNFTFNGLRFLLGAVSLIPVILISDRRAFSGGKLKKTLRASLLAGTALFVASGLQQQGISMNHNAGKSGFITCLYTVFVPAAGWLVYKKKPGANTWIAAALSVFGLFLLSVGDGFDRIEAGDAVVLAGSFFLTVHLLIVDKSVKTVNPIAFSCIQFAVSGAWNILFALMTETITLSGIAGTAYPILYTGFLSTGVAYTCQMVGQKYSDPSLAAILLSTECVFGAVGGAIFLGETFTAKGYIGCALIFAGILLSQFKKTEK